LGRFGGLGSDPPSSTINSEFGIFVPTGLGEVASPVVLSSGARPTRNAANDGTSGPIPKFVSIRGTFGYELRNQRTTSNLMILCGFEFEVPMTIVPQQMNRNFKFTALGAYWQIAVSG